MRAWIAGVILLLASASAAHSQNAPGEKPATPACGPRVIVEYTDDDPDYFIIKNRSPEGWNLVMLAIDLSRSSGVLVFDTDDGGPGVGGASPFFATFESPVRLVGTVPAADGGRTVGLRFEEFTAGRDYSFHVDVDALHQGDGRTWVLPSDTVGAMAVATFQGPSGQSEKVDAIFSETGEADSGAGGCV